MSTRIDKLEHLLKEQPEDPFLLFALAQEWLKSNEDHKALEFFNTLREKHPDYVGTYYHLGQLLEKSGQNEKALSVYKEGMKVALEQGDQHSYSELKQVYELMEG